MGGVIDIQLPANSFPKLVVQVGIDFRSTSELVRRIQEGVGEEHLMAWLAALGEVR